MFENRLRPGAYHSGLLLLTLISFGSCAAPINAAATANFKCADSRILQVQYDAKRANVIAEGRPYALPRQASGLGMRYASPTATLIIDGNFAAFVADDLYDLRGCHSPFHGSQR